MVLSNLAYGAGQYEIEEWREGGSTSPYKFGSQVGRDDPHFQPSHWCVAPVWWSVAIGLAILLEQRHFEVSCNLDQYAQQGLATSS